LLGVFSHAPPRSHLFLLLGGPGGEFIIFLVFWPFESFGFFCIYKNVGVTGGTPKNNITVQQTFFDEVQGRPNLKNTILLNMFCSKNGKKSMETGDLGRNLGFPGGAGLSTSSQGCE
jgi:hypothetical protein